MDNSILAQKNFTENTIISFLNTTLDEFKLFLSSVDQSSLNKEERQHLLIEMFNIISSNFNNYYNFIIEESKRNEDVSLILLQKDALLMSVSKEQAAVLFNESSISDCVLTVSIAAIDNLDCKSLKETEDFIYNIFGNILIEYGLKIGIFSVTDSGVVSLD